MKPSIIGLALPLDMGTTYLFVFGDFQLVVRHLKEIYKVRKPEFVPYYRKAKQSSDQFVFFHINHVCRPENAQVDALAKLASALTLPYEQEIDIHDEQRLILPPVIENIPDKVKICDVLCEQIKVTDSRYPLIEYHKHKRMSTEAKKRVELRR